MMERLTMDEALTILEKAEACSSEERKELQKKRLKELVVYVRENSLYFRELYKDLPENYTLEDLPPTKKENLILQYENWVTDREISKEDVLAYIETPVVAKEPFLGKYSALTTSGTTGEPMPMLRDSYHNTIHGALTRRRLFPKESAGFMNAAHNKIAAIIFTSPRVSSYGSFLRAREAQKEFAHNMIAISPEEGTETIVQKLNDFQPDVVTCYPSAMCAMAMEQKKGNLHIKPKLIACSAELLTEEMYKLFKETFGCVVINNYCSTEGGEAAMSSACSSLHINEDWVIIEPVDSEGNLITDPQQWSDGVLITDLTNYIQPIIRYHMSDRIRIHQDCYCGNPFPYMEIRGRAGGVTEVCGKTVMIANMHLVVENLQNAYTVQIVQISPGTLELRAIAASEEEREKIFKEMTEKLSAVLDKEGCRGYHIVTSVLEPERNKRGGKLQYFVRKEY